MKNDSLFNRKVSGYIEVTIPILKDLVEDDGGFPLSIGVVCLNLGEKNFLIDPDGIHYKNDMKAGSNITFNSRLFVDLETFPKDEEFNYELTESDLESGQVTATIYISDHDVASGEECFDFDNIIYDLVVYVDGKEYSVNKVDLD